MKKSLFVLGLAVAALTSCTENEVVDVAESRVIGFDSYVNNSTRAVNVTTKDNLEKIYVIGYEKATSATSATDFTSLFDHVPVTYDSSSKKWGYDSHKHWQRNTLYRFAAYATGVENNASMFNDVNYDPDGDSITISNYTPNGNDLIAAISGDKNVGETIPSDRVAFSFHHLLSRVKVSFKLGTAFNAVAKISNVRIVDAINQGTGVYEYVQNSKNISWTGTATIGDAYTLVSEETVLTTDFQEFEVFVIPQLTTNIKLQFTYTTYEQGGTEVIHNYTKEASLTVPNNITDGKWKEAYIYNYICTFGLEADETPIEFTVYNVEGWTAANESGIVLTPTDVTVANN